MAWWIIRDGGADEPFCFHAPQRDIDRSALQTSSRCGDEFQSVALVASEEFENESLCG